MYLGAGIYNHYIPAAVKMVMSRTEFQTSYTPYQAEISQGLLQSLFEFQSMICDLTEMDAVNSSLYDGSTALGEAARMSVRLTGRYKILVPKCLHPDKTSVLENYTRPVGIKIVQYDYDRETGCANVDDLQMKLDRETASVIFETPTFFGTLDPESVRIPSLCHEVGALAIQSFDPISLGGLKPPGSYEVDIVVAEGQSISVETNFGGPLLGIIGCRGETLLRQMPGRLIGLTTTADGKSRAYSMVLQTREQHIRRERATSNICTNEALLGIGAAVYLSLLGPHGLRELFETILSKTDYAIKQLSEVPNIKAPAFNANHYQEFVISLQGKNNSVSSVNNRLIGRGIHGGRDLSKGFPELGESMLMCVNEMHSTSMIENLCTGLETVLAGEKT
jgi:glycine dehydrogenase subunit 1